MPVDLPSLQDIRDQALERPIRIPVTGLEVTMNQIEPAANVTFGSSVEADRPA
jgi:hypothetical protein